MWVHYTDGSSQRLKRDEDNDRNHDKKAIAADSWYLVHSFAVQNPPEASRRLVTLAVEQDAANDRNDSTYTTMLLLLFYVDAMVCKYMNCKSQIIIHDQMAYPIPYNNNGEYPRLTSWAFNEN